MTAPKHKQPIARTSKLTVTAAPFQSLADGKWYMVVSYGTMHDRLPLRGGPDDALEALKREYGLTPAQARRLLAKAVPV